VVLGFVGSHLCERLLNEGNEVYCLDNFLLDKRKRNPFIIDPYFELIRHDVTAPLLKLMKFII
jgi:UDP-glucuronate decarboxylase